MSQKPLLKGMRSVGGTYGPIGRAGRQELKSRALCAEATAPDKDTIRGDGAAGPGCRGADLPEIRIDGSVELALGSTPGLESGDDGLRLVVDGDGVSSVTLDVREAAEGGWVVAVTANQPQNRLSGLGAPNHDALTGLADRQLSCHDIEGALDRARSGGSMLAVFYVDLDNFKRINDTFGHAVGDAVLVEVGRRLRSTCPPTATAGRLGGDEFVVVWTGLSSVREAVEVGDRLADSFRDPAVIGDIELAVTPSIGAALSRGEVLTCDEILRRADAAMYRAKGSGKVEMYADADVSQLTRRALVESQVTSVAVGREFEMFYQPIYALDRPCIVGVEAFLRWHRDGIVGSTALPTVWGDSGHAREIAKWTLEQGIEDMARFRTVGLPADARLHVNVTAQQMLDRRIVDAAVQALKGMGLPGESVVFEVPAGLMSTGFDEAIAEELRELGIRFAVDGFGTGRSSLAALSSMPAEILKIDTQMLSSFCDETQMMSLMSAMVGLGHAHQMAVVASGVSSKSHLDHLRLLTYDAAQGPAVLPPLPADTFLAHLESSTTTSTAS